MARNIAESYDETVAVQGQKVAVIAAGRVAGAVPAGDIETGKFRRFARQQPLLNLLGNTQRIFQPLFLDMFLDQIVRPLTETASQIDLQIKAMLEDQEFVLAQEDEVPNQYQKLVADYFKALSEAEGSQ